jgi:hypothetical protein
VEPGERREVVLTVERERLGPDGAPRRVSMTVRFDPAGPGGPPRAAELGEAIRALDRELDAALEAAGLPAPPVRRDRDLSELVETYHPRQAELLDVLEADGELTQGEALALRAHLAASPPLAVPLPPVPTVEVPVVDRPLAAMPLANDRTPTQARPVEQLIHEYRIETLKQAGAVRARRQISFDEYMALKRHFAEADARPAAGSPP